MQGRVELWKNKLGIGERFQGDAGTDRGTNMEPVAEKRYRQVTGQEVVPQAFKVLDDGNVLMTSWLGASPDGLIPESHPPW